jgi:hypothetical protein
MRVNALVPMGRREPGTDYDARRAVRDEETALRQQAEEVLQASLANTSFVKPVPSSAAAELDETWHSLMSLLTMDQMYAEEQQGHEKQRGVKVRLPGSTQKLGARAQTADAHRRSPRVPIVPTSSPGAKAAAAGHITRHRRPTSERVTIMHTLDAHTELRLRAQGEEAVEADEGWGLGCGAVSVVSSSSGGWGSGSHADSLCHSPRRNATPGAPLQRPAAAQAAIDAIGAKSTPGGRPGRRPLTARPTLSSSRNGSRAAPVQSVVHAQAGVPPLRAPPRAQQELQQRQPYKPLWPPPPPPSPGDQVAMRISSFQQAQPRQPRQPPHSARPMTAAPTVMSGGGTRAGSAASSNPPTAPPPSPGSPLTLTPSHTEGRRPPTPAERAWGERPASRQAAAAPARAVTAPAGARRSLIKGGMSLQITMPTGPAGGGEDGPSAPGTASAATSPPGGASQLPPWPPLIIDESTPPWPEDAPRISVSASAHGDANVHTDEDADSSTTTSPPACHFPPPAASPGPAPAPPPPTPPPPPPPYRQRQTPAEGPPRRRRRKWDL